MNGVKIGELLPLRIGLTSVAFDVPVCSAYLMGDLRLFALVGCE